MFVIYVIFSPSTASASVVSVVSKVLHKFFESNTRFVVLMQDEKQIKIDLDSDLLSGEIVVFIDKENANV